MADKFWPCFRSRICGVERKIALAAHMLQVASGTEPRISRAEAYLEQKDTTGTLNEGVQVGQGRRRGEAKLVRWSLPSAL